jgi:DNA invertase Pin-like site-specific DNA recombinase
MKYIAYYRVSTQQQGRSGLGLEAQTNIVRGYIGQNDTIIAEYQDIESGKNDNRPQLTKAIQQANDTGATLLIAKLDRLSRNAGFIFMLKDSKVNFVCCDMPEANTLTIGIFATMAQYERELISQRTKAALQAKKRRGDKLGNPDGFTASAQAKASATKAAKAANNANTSKAKSIIKDIIDLYRFRNDTLTIAIIADELNRYGCTTATGERWNKSNVRRTLKAALQALKIDTLPKRLSTRKAKTIVMKGQKTPNLSIIAA